MYSEQLLMFEYTWFNGESGNDRECNYSIVSEVTKETEIFLYLQFSFKTLLLNH